LYLDGIKVGCEWADMAQQDIPLTFNKNHDRKNYRCSLDYSMAFNGGNSIKYSKIRNDYVSSSTFNLFKTNIKLKHGLKVLCAVLTEGNIKYSIIASIGEDAKLKGIVLGGAKITKVGKWKMLEFDISGLVGLGDCIKKFDLELSGGETFDSVNVGMFCVKETDDGSERAIKCVSGECVGGECVGGENVSGLRLDKVEWFIDEFNHTSASFILSWNDDSSRYFDIYMKRPDFGYPFWYKRVYENSAKISNIYMKGDIEWKDNNIYFTVVSVGFLGQRSTMGTTIGFNWIPPRRRD